LADQLNGKAGRHGSKPQALNDACDQPASGKPTRTLEFTGGSRRRYQKEHGHGL